MASTRSAYKVQWAKAKRAHLKANDPEGYREFLEKQNKAAYLRRVKKTPEDRLFDAERRKAWDKENPERVKQTRLDDRLRVRYDVFNHYGMKCACCGESRWQFLTIDHINGGGNKQRIELGMKGHKFHRWLRRQGYPEGYRTLCYNCNCVRGHLGYCPHENPEREPEFPNPPRKRNKRRNYSTESNT